MICTTHQYDSVDQMKKDEICGEFDTPWAAAYKCMQGLVGTPEGKIPRRRFGDNIKIDLKVRGWTGMD